MNRLQSYIVYSAVAVSIGMALFPPRSFLYNGAETHVGYSFILSPATYESGPVTGGITVKTLLLQWLIVAALAACAYHAARNKE